MYEALYRYLIKFRKIDLPGIGGVALRMQPAQTEFADHHFLPPQYFFSFEKMEDVPPEKLFSWLAVHFNITEQEAVIRFTDFIFEMNRQLKEGRAIHWHRVGTLQKEFSGEIKFESENDLPWLEGVVAEKVIRENAEHTILVGESEKTSTQMTELLHPDASVKRTHWWIWPLAVILAIIIVLGLYFSQHGISGKSVGNNHVLSPAHPPSGYSLSP
jgi:hypothetical protein